MKFFLLLVSFVSCFVVQGFVNGQYHIQARTVETLVIFSFSDNFTENIINSYIKYFSYLASGRDFVLFNHLQLFFGNYNATDLIQGIDLAMLRHPLVNINNITVKAFINGFNEKTKCNDTVICDIIQNFSSSHPRNYFTQLNLMIISDICPHSSIFEEFHKNIGDGIFLRTFLISHGKNQICDIDSEVLNYHFIPPPDFNSPDKNDLATFQNRTIISAETNGGNYLIIFIKKENYDAAIKFIADYYNDTTNCNDLAAPSKDERDKSYLITMRVTNDDDKTSKDITIIFPKIDFTKAKFTFEEYLRYIIDYTYLQEGLQNEIDKYIHQYMKLYHLQNIVIFTDNYNSILGHNSNTLANETRTVDYILYLDSINIKDEHIIVKNVKKKFYREDSKNSKVAFHIMTPENFLNDSGENFCQRLNKAIPFVLLRWHLILIGLVVLVLVIIFGIFYHKFLRRQDLYSKIFKDVPLENREEFSKANDRLYIKEGKFKINFNSVKGYGVSSTVYEATISSALLSSLTRKSIDNSISEDCIVAAKLLNRSDQEERNVVKGEIEAARMLEKHDKICTLLGWSSHMGAPCLLFELMEQDLESYIVSLRVPLSSFGSDRGSTVEFKEFIVPDFDGNQRKIFLQILWQVSQGLEYIASKNIVHRDVAARNILISHYGDSNTFTAKIADFGLCVTVNKETKEYHRVSQSKRLPIKLFAPECHFGKIFSEASDVWAFGLLMVEVYSLSGPLYPGIKINELPEYLKNGGRMEKPEKMPDDIYDLAFECWKEDPNSRKSFFKLSKELKEKLRSLDPENDAYTDYWHLQIEDEELMESFSLRKLKTN